MIKKLKDILTQPETVIVIYSLLITLGISFLIGIGGYLISNKFWGYFVIATSVQVIAFAIINTYLLRKDTIANNEFLTKQLETLSKFSIKLSCAYCKTPNVTPIQLNQENRFKCESCNQINSVRMQFFAAQVTTPLTKVLIPAGENETIEFTTS